MVPSAQIAPSTLLIEARQSMDALLIAFSVWRRKQIIKS
jgi:hypothetical protein